MLGSVRAVEASVAMLDLLPLLSGAFVQEVALKFCGSAVAVSIEKKVIVFE
jgi:hypothetical protein